MSHKKVKTQPCMSPDSPFMRKPSKEFLQKLTFNKLKPKELEKNMLKSSESYAPQNFNKISFIPCGIATNLQASKNDPTKLKKTTIELDKFKIKHENMILKTQLQEIRRNNLQLTQQNKALRKQNEELKKQFEGSSRISKFSSETLQHTDRDQVKRKNKFISLGSQESLLEIQNYEILPATMEISQVNSLEFEEELKSCEQLNFLSTSLNRKLNSLQELKQPKGLKKNRSISQEIVILSNRIQCLEKQLQKALLRQKALEDENQSLRLCASMSKRKLQVKDSQLKEIKIKSIKQKKKKLSENLFVLSSEEDNEND